MYQLTNSTSITRLSDGANIPPAPSNIDYQEYLAWTAEGNTPLPVDPPTVDQIKACVNAECQKIILARFSLIHQIDVAHGLYPDNGMKQWIADMIIESNRCHEQLDLIGETTPVWPIYEEVI